MASKYDNVSWVGIDGGREGLWRDPLWTTTLAIIAEHEDENVYAADSPIYQDLYAAFPNEKWCSKTRAGQFRPLFRDYAHPWTRTGVVSLTGRKFHTTATGHAVLSRTTTKQDVLIQMFMRHSETTDCGIVEKPFAILSAAFSEAKRLLSTTEVYWIVMKNYRPGSESFDQALRRSTPFIEEVADPTPYRRLRSMLSLMRAADLLVSHRRDGGTHWAPANPSVLQLITQ